ncbi:MAG: DUF1850 domain-containing protein [Spirochaetaceae bacterium]|nr:MAG: DUF1850 domain-containing protein [Spirochaetaceae bacterium]
MKRSRRSTAWRVSIARRVLLAAALGVLLVSAGGGERRYSLHVTRTRGDELIAELPISAGDEFSLHYTHSVSNTPVSGEFRITTDGRIEPTVTRFVSFGPGLPWTPGTDHQTDADGRIVYTHFEDPRDELLLWVSELTAETLVLGETAVQLYRPGGAFDRIAVRVETRGRAAGRPR